ncbi:MAG: ABC transporter permease [Bacteroidales bacterium]
MKNKLKIIFQVFIEENKLIFNDTAAILLLVLAGLAYPIVYNCVYYNDIIQDMPIAVIDESGSQASRTFLRKIDATPEIKIERFCTDMLEAKDLMKRRKVHGIICIPRDYEKRLANLQQATISTYADMSALLYYKNLAYGTNYVMLDEMKRIQTERYNMKGISGEDAKQLVQAVPYIGSVFYNPAGGMAAFLLPIILILVLQQTMFFGVSLVAGTAREANKFNTLFSRQICEGGVGSVVIGKSLAYFLIYVCTGTFILGFIPIMFHLPHIGTMHDIFILMIPYILSIAFMSLTLSTMIKRRESGLILFAFFSVVLLFLTGFSWPESNMPKIWTYVSYIFPSTFASHAYVKINTAGATISDVRLDYMILWIQTGIYFISACISFRLSELKMFKSYMSNEKRIN